MRQRQLFQARLRRFLAAQGGKLRMVERRQHCTQAVGTLRMSRSRLVRQAGGMGDKGDRHAGKDGLTVDDQQATGIASGL